MIKKSYYIALLLFVVLWDFSSLIFAQGQPWITKEPMPTARVCLSTSTVNGKIYAVGGWNGANALSTVEEYDPESNTWTSKKPMLTGRVSLTTSAVNGKIYAIGGSLDLGGVGVPTNEEYDPISDTWITKKPMDIGRTILSSSVVNEKIYVLGGGLGPVQWWVDTVDEYDPATDTWKSKAPMPTARWGLSSCAVNNKIYSVGGANTAGGGFKGGIRSVESYEPLTNSWESSSNMPTRRLYLTSSASDGKIYAIGGNPDFGIWLSTVEEYDPVTNSWMVKTSMPTARWGLSASTVNAKIYAIGGSSSTNWSDPPIATVEEYNPLLDPIMSVNDHSPGYLTKFFLGQNYPNPFNPSTNIEFSIAKSEFVTLKIYNILGREVSTLVSERLTAGKYKYEWDASELASGVYLYRLETEGFLKTRKMILMK